MAEDARAEAPPPAPMPARNEGEGAVALTVDPAEHERAIREAVALARRRQMRAEQRSVEPGAEREAGRLASLARQGWVDVRRLVQAMASMPMEGDGRVHEEKAASWNALNAKLRREQLLGEQKIIACSREDGEDDRRSATGGCTTEKLHCLTSAAKSKALNLSV